MSLVPDSSVTLAWIYSDETTDAIRAVFDQVADADFRRAALADLTLLDIIADQPTDPLAWGETLILADHFGIAVYDAAYLELARRRTLPLATVDEALCAAAAALGVGLPGGHDEP